MNSRIFSRIVTPLFNKWVDRSGIEFVNELFFSLLSFKMNMHDSIKIKASLQRCTLHITNIWWNWLVSIVFFRSINTSFCRNFYKSFQFWKCFLSKQRPIDLLSFPGNGKITSRNDRNNFSKYSIIRCNSSATRKIRWFCHFIQLYQCQSSSVFVQRISVAYGIEMQRLCAIFLYWFSQQDYDETNPCQQDRGSWFLIVFSLLSMCFLSISAVLMSLGVTEKKLLEPHPIWISSYRMKKYEIDCLIAWWFGISLKFSSN